MSKPIILAIANQKGGVAKTTTCESLAAAFTAKGLKTLLIDMDPQTNASQHCGFDLSVADTPFLTMYEVLSPTQKGATSLSECIQHCPSFDLAPACSEMAALEIELSAKLSVKQLAKAIRNDPVVMDTYDVIVIDGGPTQGMLTTNILCAANFCLIPTHCSIDSRNAVLTMVETIRDIKSEFNESLDTLGIAITQYERVTKVGQKTKSDIYEIGKELNLHVFSTEIRRCAAVEKAKDANTNVIAFDHTCAAAVDYMNLADEMIAAFREKGVL